MKALSRPRQWKVIFGAALLLLLTLTSCGEPLPGESWAGISSDGQYVYVAFQQNLFRIYVDPGNPAATRQIEWVAQTPEKAHLYAPPTLSEDGMMYVGGYDGKVHVFSTAGKHIASWNTSANQRIVGNALIHKFDDNSDFLYVGMGDHGIRAFDRKSGTERWSYLKSRYGVWGAPVVVGGTLYFGSLDHHLYALNAKDGSYLWDIDLGGAIADSPLHDNGILYVGTFKNELVAVSLETRQIVRRYPTRGWVWGTPRLKDGKLYFGDLKGWVYKIDANTFTLEWEKNDPERPDKAIRGSLAFAKVMDGNKEREIVIAGSESKYLRAYYTDTGDVRWTSAISADASILSDLIVIGNDVIFTTLSDQQIVAAFNVEKGNKSWQVNLPNEVTRIQTATTVPPATRTPGPATAAPQQ